MGIKDKAEIKIGLEKQFNKNCSIWPTALSRSLKTATAMWALS